MTARALAPWLIAAAAILLVWLAVGIGDSFGSLSQVFIR